MFDAARGEWSETAPPLAGTAEGEVHEIRTLVRAGKYRQALAMVNRFAKRHGDSHPLYAEVILAKAEAQIGRRDYYKAHLTLQEFLSAYRGMPLTAEALRLEFVIAETFLTGVKRKVWGIRLLSGEEEALKILDEIVTDYSDSPIAELARKTKADYLFRKGEHIAAEGDYQRLVTDYPRGRYHAFGLRRLAEAALAGFAGVEFDEVALAEARERFSDYRARYPARAQAEDVAGVITTIDELAGEKEFLIASYYERTEHLGSAVFYFDSVRRKWPTTIAATKATRRLELLGAAGTSAGDKAFESKEAPPSTFPENR